MSPEEVDLTGATPPKKMKQARLPFAPRPLNKQTTVPESKDASRKRKLSGSDEREENLTPSKAPRKEEMKMKVPEVTTADTIKSKLAKFAHKDETDDNEKKEMAEDKKNKRNINIKPKKDKNKQLTDDEARVESLESEKKEKETGKFHGLLKMPFKKAKKKDKKESDDPEEDFELVLESSVDESAITEESSMTSFSSMTDEWANFHEKHDTDQAMEDLELGDKTAQSKKTKMEKQKDKEEKLKRKQEEKALKEEEKAKAKAEKEKQKQLQKEEKEKQKEEKIKAKPTDKVEEKPAVKVNTLAKFLIRGKDAERKSAANSEKEKKLTSAEQKEKKLSSAEPEPVVSSTSDSSVPSPTPAPTSPSTPAPGSACPTKPVFSSGSSTPEPNRAQKVNIAKLKVKLTELNIAMEKAVEEKDYLKAHEAKEKLKNLEDSIKKMESDPNYTSEVLSESVAAPAAPKTPQTPRNVSVVSTPGSSKTSAVKSSKKEALEKERQAKREALEKEKLAKKAALELEKQSKKEAKEKERIEKEKQKEIEKQAKAEEKQEKEKQRKAEKEKVEAEKLRLKQEKEEEKLRKKAEKEAELKQKEEEKRQQELAEKEKAKKEANVFRSFFKKEDPGEKKDNLNSSPSKDTTTGHLTAFRVKKDMRLAPLVRGDPERAKRNIDSLDMPSGPDGLYLAQLRDGYTAGRQGRTWPYERPSEKESDDVEILEDEEEEEESDPEDELNETNINIIMRKGDKTVKTRAKLLKFHENQRPAYWGTWTKTSKYISGRHPFGRDEERFDYEYDSDDDWEEEEEGESLSDDEKDKEEDEENEDYEVDNEFFVPHGYLSDEEEDKEEDEVLDPETAKEKQKLAAKNFEKEHKKKTQELKPRLWGTYFPDGEDVHDAATLQMAKILSGYAAIIIGNNNVVDTSFTKKAVSPTVSKDDAPASARSSAAVKGSKARIFPEEAVSDLVRLVHGNNNNKMFLAREFLAFWSRKTGEESNVAEEGSSTPSGKSGSISKKKVVDKIQEIAEYRRPEEGGGKCWLVKVDILAAYGVTSPRSWEYLLEQPNKNTNTEDGAATRPESPACPALAPANLITKFAKVLTEEEKEAARARQEREALAARQKKEEQAAKLAAMKAELAVKQVVVGPSMAGGDKVNSPLQRFSKALSEMEKKCEVASGAAPKKRVSLTPVLPSAKNNPIVSIAGGPSKAPTPSGASPIAVKRKPGNVGLKASPIAVKRKAGTASTSTAPSFKGLFPDSVTVTPVRPEEPIECINLDD